MDDLKERQLVWVIAWQDNGDEKALLSLIGSMKGTIIEQMNRCRWSNVCREDMIAAGQTGVIVAAKKFDRHRHNACFSAAADVHIKNQVMTLAQMSGVQTSFAKSKKEQRVQRYAVQYVSKLHDEEMAYADAIRQAALQLKTDEKHVSEVLVSSQSVQADDADRADFLVAQEEPDDDGIWESVEHRAILCSGPTHVEFIDQDDLGVCEFG